MQEWKTPRKIKIDIPELANAMEDASYEHSYYLYLEEEAPDGEAADEKFDLESSLKQLDLPDWQKDALREADEVERGFGIRYVSILRADSSEAYGDIEDFIATVHSQRLQDRLYQAISGSHPFRRFKDVLAASSTERECWFSFQENRLRKRALEWLEDEGIEPDISAENS